VKTGIYNVGRRHLAINDDSLTIYRLKDDYRDTLFPKNILTGAVRYRHLVFWLPHIIEGARVLTGGLHGEIIPVLAGKTADDTFTVLVTRAVAVQRHWWVLARVR